MSTAERLPLAIPPRDRFVRAIADRIDPDRIVEMHLFAPIRQGGVETGVAVIAAELPVQGVNLDENETAENDPAQEPAGRGPQPTGRPNQPTRHTVFTAWYRLTLKGPDRGKWEFNFADEAVAPLQTIVAVARGVGERAGDADDPERWTGEHFRTALSESAPLVKQ